MVLLFVSERIVMKYEICKRVYGKELKHKIAVVLPLLMFYVFYMAAFRVIETVPAVRYYNPFVKIDSLIPFNQYFVIPYILWFFWIPFVCVYLLFKDEQTFRWVSVFLMCGMTLFIVISALFPTILYLRPKVMPDQGICCRLVEFIYSVDTPTNVFPSIHVYNTMVAFYGIMQSRGKLFMDRGFRFFSFILSILIIMSTVFLKQHSLIDVAGAVLMYSAVLFAGRVKSVAQSVNLS